ncbi:MAG: hypothetical protein WC789_02590 [Lentisphaeria bacterium]|jgi:hypothetical protein
MTHPHPRHQPPPPPKPPPARKRLLRGCLKAIRWLLKPTVILGLGTLALTDAWLEIQGAPPWLVARVEHALQAKGIHAEIRGLRAGLVGGITAEEVTVLDGAASRTPMLAAHRLRAGISKRRLLTGRLHLRTVEVERLAVYLPQNPAAPLPPHKLLIARLTGALRLHANRIEVESLRGDVAGVRVQAQGQITGLNLTRAAGPTAWSWQTIFAALGERERGWCIWLLNRFHAEGAPLNDGWIDLVFDVPAREPEHSAFSGNLSLTDLTLYGVDISTLRTRFEARNRTLRLQRLAVKFFSGQQLEADLEARLSDQTLAGRVTGNAKPAEVLPLLRLPIPELLRDAEFYAPVHFTLDLEPSPWLRPQEWRGNVSLATEHIKTAPAAADAAQLRLRLTPDATGPAGAGELTLAGVEIGNARFQSVRSTFTFDRDRLTAADIRLQVGADATEAMAGRVTYAFRGQTLEGDLQGTLQPATLLSLLPALPERIRTLGGEFKPATPPHVAARLDPSPATNPAAWRGRLEVGLGEARFRDLRLSGGQASAEFKPGQVTLDATLTAAEPPQDLTTHLELDTAAERIQGQLHGRLHLDWLLAGLRLHDSFVGQRIHQPDAPLEFNLRLDQSPLPPAAWSGSGTLTAAAADYEDLSLRNLTCPAFAFRPGHLAFHRITTQTAAGETLAGNLDLALPSGEITLQARIHGDPRLTRVFVAPGASRTLYDEIWRDCKWDPKRLPDITISHLRFRDSEKDRPWEFELDTQIAATGCSWRGVPVESVSTDLQVRLPGALHCRNAQIQTRDGTLTGNVELYFGGLSMCRFNLAGTLDPRLLLRTLNPDWDRYFADIQFGERTRFACDGHFLLAPEPRPILRGTLDSGQCTYRRLRLENLSARWLLDGQRLAWLPVVARLYDGRVFGSGEYDFGAEFGRIILNGGRIKFNDLLRAVSDSPRDIQGELSASCRLDLYRLRPEADLSITGAGDLWIRDGDLWNIPVMNRLGKLVGLSTFGRIGKLQTNLVFAGDHVRIEDLTTDGTILSLQGTGDYAWKNRALQMNVRGTTLQQTKIIPWLLSPFFSIFEAGLTGTVEDPHWTLGRRWRRRAEP